MLIQLFIWLFILPWTEKLGFDLLSLSTTTNGKFVYYIVTGRNLIYLFDLLLCLLVA